MTPEEHGRRLFLAGHMGERIGQHVATCAANAGVSRRSFIGSASGLAAAMLAVNQITGTRLFEGSEVEAHDQGAGQDRIVDARRAATAQWIAAPIQYKTGVPFQLGYGAKHVQGCWCGPQFPNSVLLVAGDWDKGTQPQSYRNEVFIYDLYRTHANAGVPTQRSLLRPPGDAAAVQPR